MVEDGGPTREIFRRMLEGDGWAGAVAANGREALASVAQGRPGLIVLDLMMPEMDGFELLTELQRHPEWRSIPVMVATAKDLTPEDRGFLNGSLMLSGAARRVVQKASFSREDLLREVRDLLTVWVWRRGVAPGGEPRPPPRGETLADRAACPRPRARGQ
jgi:CheY-like chemotaxis protein